MHFPGVQAAELQIYVVSLTCHKSSVVSFMKVADSFEKLITEWHVNNNLFYQWVKK